MKKSWKKQLSRINRKKFEIELISIPLTQESQYLFKQYKVERYLCKNIVLEDFKEKSIITHL